MHCFGLDVIANFHLKKTEDSPFETILYVLLYYSFMNSLLHGHLTAIAGNYCECDEKVTETVRSK